MSQLCKPIVEKAKRDYAELQVDPKKGILNVEIHPEIFTYNSKSIIAPQKEKEISKSTTRSNRVGKKDVDGTSSLSVLTHKPRETRSVTAAKRKKNKRSLPKNPSGTKPKAPKGWAYITDDEGDDDDVIIDVVGVGVENNNADDEATVSSRTRSRNQTISKSQNKVVKGNVGRPLKQQRHVRAAKRQKIVKSDTLEKSEKSINEVSDKPEVTTTTEPTRTYPDEKYKVIKEQLENTLKVAQEESEKPAGTFNITRVISVGL